MLQTTQNLTFELLLLENTKILHLLDFFRLDRICICFQLLTKITLYNHHKCLWISVLRVAYAFSFFFFNAHWIFLTFIFPSIKTIDDSVKTAFIRALLVNVKPAHNFLAGYSNQSVFHYFLVPIVVTSSFAVVTNFLHYRKDLNSMLPCCNYWQVAQWSHEYSSKRYFKQACHQTNHWTCLWHY